MIHGQQVVDEARTWLGTKWSHQASLKGVATDCIGLIVGVGRALGLLGEFDQHAPEFRGYGMTPKPLMLLAAADRFLDRIQVTQVRPGDIYVMRFQRDPTHFAILTSIDNVDGNDTIIHAYTQARQVVEHGIDETWRGRVLRAYRFRGIGD